MSIQQSEELLYSKNLIVEMGFPPAPKLKHGFESSLKEKAAEVLRVMPFSVLLGLLVQ